jgi:hypothetical protein
LSPLPLMVPVADAAISVLPASNIAPSVQLKVPVTVTVAVPRKVPPVSVNDGKL